MGRVYLPSAPSTVSRGVAARLGATVDAARAAGLALRVAIVASAADLGAAFRFLRRPQAYARFLEKEISIGARVPLLVVTPAGIGTAGLPAGARRAATSLREPAGASADHLAAAATTAVANLAAGEGLRLELRAPRAESSDGSSSGSPPLWLLGVPLLVLISAALLARWRRRMQRG